MTLNNLHNLENEVKVIGFHHVLCIALVPLCTKFSETASNMSSDIKQEPYQMNLNDLDDFEIKVKVMRCEHDLCLAMGLLCTKFGESSSNINSDIERKPF